jgi:hypothetical protein
LSITSTAVRDWIRAYAAEVAQHRVELVQLDTVIGDGDHGTNMDRGVRKAVERLDGVEGEDIDTVRKTVGMALVSSVGGAAGPLYGTLFLQMGTASAGRDALDLAGWTAALDAGVKGVQSAQPLAHALLGGARVKQRAEQHVSGQAPTASTFTSRLTVLRPRPARSGRRSCPPRNRRRCSPPPPRPHTT